MWPSSFAFVFVSLFYFIHFCGSCSCFAYIIFTLCICCTVILPSKELKAAYQLVYFGVYTFPPFKRKAKAAYNNIVLPPFYLPKIIFVKEAGLRDCDWPKQITQ